MGRRLFPAFIDLQRRDVLVVGGGPVAAGKLDALLDAGARVTVVAPHVVPDIERRAVTIRRRRFAPDDLDGCWFVVAAAPPEVNARIVEEAERRRLFVNAVDDPAHATSFAGSVVRRGPVAVAISTGGEAPALARLLREALERLLPADLDGWVRAAIELRGEWRANGVPMEARTGRLLAALCELHAEAGVGGRTSARETTQRASRRGGHVAIVGAGPGDPALMTRRGAVRLAEADLVLYDALVAPEVVAMATRAQRVFVGRRRGRESVSQQAIHRVMIGAARRGRQVVRLKGGDPFVFGRGGEDAMALADAGVPFEIVPGVSAAFGAPALASIPVTHRQVSSAVLVTTGHDPARLRRLADAIPAGSVTLVIMMALADRAAAARALVNAGWTSRTPVAVIRGASTPHQLTWTGTLGELIDERDPPFDARLPGTLVVGDVVSLRERIVGRRSVAAPAAAIEVGHG